MDFFHISASEHPIRMAVLISGGGRTLMNFVEQIEAGHFAGEIVLVVADRECAGIKRATSAGLSCVSLDRRASDFSETVFAEVRSAGADLVLMAGFLAKLEIPEDFSLRVMNIHPSLLPSFGGKGFYGERVHRAAIDRGVRFSGCTVHFADPHYDEGPIIMQQVVPVQDDDTPETLAARVFEAECQAYPEAVRRYAEGRLSVRDRRVITAGK